MTDCESLACGDVGLLPDVSNANDLLKACLPMIDAARKACWALHQKAIAETAIDTESHTAVVHESEDAAARYKALIITITELTERYA